ncbi:Ribose-phosphate pyrophosphokinase [Rickettsiales endosymbiont of Paramecium tredecaurelia]|uniref:ribose-phosphate diphosphokinase n=1 Tax=Candidatus Sarmatiella mevalonica TaxID=2770581 RepID=UPI0019250A0F|nr:ribose-phosphate diphosphokinase [Candidatus Sarmatiella mevalonica]MBL3284293.1 Ribose-phosphate pyrophosphokinase [Candidatus Sarmatiella mevalonica]
MGYILISPNCAELYRQLCTSSMVIANFTPLFIKTHIFSDQEIEITINTANYSNQSIVLLISFQNPNQNLVELLFILDHLQHKLNNPRDGLSNVIIIAPYFCYARSDKTPEHQPNPMRCLSNIIKQYNIQRIITLDLHSQAYFNYFSHAQLTNIDPSENFCQMLSKIPDLTLIAPDAGGSQRVRRMARQLGAHCLFMHKHRTRDVVSFRPIQCSHKLKNCVIVDDILDTGSTMLQIIAMLQSFKPFSINIVVTHLLLSKNREEFLRNQSIKHIYTTNSICHKQSIHRGAGLDDADKKIQIVPIANLIERALIY